MKFKIEFEGDTKEDSMAHKLFVHSGDMYRALLAIKKDVRTRIQFVKEENKEEMALLKSILDTCNVAAFWEPPIILPSNTRPL